MKININNQLEYEKISLTEQKMVELLEVLDDLYYSGTKVGCYQLLRKDAEELFLARQRYDKQRLKSR